MQRGAPDFREGADFSMRWSEGHTAGKTAERGSPLTVALTRLHPQGAHMGLLDSLIKTAVNVATLPVAVAVDVLEAPKKAVEGKIPGTTTARHLERIKDDLLN